MPTTNRMVEKSKRAIKDALLELMYEKDFSSISVNELLKKANISRGTFYAHFKNLEDVRQQLVNDLYDHADMLFSGYKASDLADDPMPIMLIAADMMIESRDPAKRLFKFVNVYDLGVMLKDWLSKFILDDDVLVKRMGGFEKAQIYSRFIAGGVMHAYNMWIMDDFTGSSSNELAQALCEILTTGLNGILSPKE